MTNGNGPPAAGRTTGSPTDGPPSMQTAIGAGGGQQGAQNQQNGPNNPMAALMSVADNLPPGSPQSARGSPPGSIGGPNAQLPGGPRSASRGSQHSPNSTGMYFTHVSRTDARPTCTRHPAPRDAFEETSVGGGGGRVPPGHVCVLTEIREKTTCVRPSKKKKSFPVSSLLHC